MAPEVFFPNPYSNWREDQGARAEWNVPKERDEDTYLSADAEPSGIASPESGRRKRPASGAASYPVPQNPASFDATSLGAAFVIISRSAGLQRGSKFSTAGVASRQSAAENLAASDAWQFLATKSCAASVAREKIATENGAATDAVAIIASKSRAAFDATTF